MLTTIFENGTFEVHNGEAVLVSQPFRPTSTGEQPAWVDEAEAMDWYNNNLKDNLEATQQGA
jgi:CO dehydrogenase/acetyl-CoA synthase alpha subunit